MPSSRVPLAAGLLLVVAGRAGAWGPHTKISRAALAVLPDRPRLQELLAAGHEAERKKGMELTAGCEARLDVRLGPDRVPGTLAGESRGSGVGSQPDITSA